MNAARLQEQSFAEGLERQFVKCALNPRLAEKLTLDPRRLREFLGEGESIFARSYKSKNPFSGLLRNNFLKTVSALRQSQAMHAPGSGAHGALERTIKDSLLAFRSQKDRQLMEIGSTALGRKQMLRNAGMATGIGAGAVGGLSVGAELSQQREQGATANAPFSSRLQYLFDPSKLPSMTNSTMSGAESMSDQTQ
jgi:hypothetical protein